MATEPRDIATTFASGVNVTDFQRDYVDELTTTADMSKKDAQAFVGFTTVINGIRPPGTGQLYTAGTLNIGIGDGATPLTPNQQLAIDNAIAAQTGLPFAGPILSGLEAGQYPGEQIYVFDGERQNPATGVGSWCYWDGSDSWRYIGSDAVAVTP